MKTYKISLFIIILMGMIFIATSDPMKSLYKSSASIIAGLNTDNKDENKKKEKYLICIDPGHQEKGDWKGEPIGPDSPKSKGIIRNCRNKYKKTRICFKFRSI